MLVTLFNLLPSYTTTQGDWVAFSPVTAPLPLTWDGTVDVPPGVTYKYQYVLNSGQECEVSTLLTVSACDPDPRENDVIILPKTMELDVSLVEDSRRSSSEVEASDSGLAFPASWPVGTNVYDLFYTLGPEVDLLSLTGVSISILTSEFGTEAATGIYLATYLGGDLQGQVAGKQITYLVPVGTNLSDMVIRVGATQRGKFRILIRETTV